MKKKAQGLSINIIIVAAIGIIVLISLAFIFRTEVGKFTKTTDCSAREGICLANIGNCPDDKPIKVFTNDCNAARFDEAVDKYVVDKDGKSPGQCCIPLS
ncbi:MAG: hypothetical protein U9O94_03740 [Nanoarchaeota archaeon]|nr:hypothetical protein [Nanoarchaeota archaeon]